MAVRSKPPECCALRAVKRAPQRKLEELALVAKALADPNRIEIMLLLAQQAGPVCACDIVQHFDLSQPTVSHHLNILKDAGLLRGGRSGLWAFYEAEPAGVGILEGITRLLGSRQAP
ncbi:MAG: ArsR/SmtB family transcription factor [Woeseiaceae bacterium]